MADPKKTAKTMITSALSALVVGAIVLVANFSGAVAVVAGLFTLVIVASALMDAF